MTPEATFRITAETSQAEQALRKFTAGMSKEFNLMGKTAGLALGVLSVGAITSFAAAAFKAADQVGDMAARAGVAVESFSRLKYAAEQNDVEISSLAVGIKTLQKSLSEATSGSKEAADKFDRLGLSATELKELSLEDQFGRIADAFQKIRNPADRSRIAMDLFGKSGQDLVPLLALAAAGIKALTSESDALGRTLDQKTADAIDRTDKALTRLNGTLKDWTGKGAGYLVLGIEGAAESVARFFHGADTLQGQLVDQRDELLQQRSSLVKSIAADEDSLARAGATQGRVLRTYIEANKRDLAALEQQLNVVNGQLLQIDKDSSQLAKTAAVQSGQQTDKAVSIFEKSVNPQTMALFAQGSAWLDAYDKDLNDAEKMTQTAAEQMLDQWNKFDIAIALQMQEGSLTAAQAAAQQKEYLDKILPEQKVSATKIEVLPIRTTLDDDLDNLQQRYGAFTDTATKSFSDMYALIDTLRAQDLILETKASQSRQRLADIEKASRLSAAHELFGGLSTLQDAGSRRAFEIAKAAAIANSTLYLYEGLSAAMKESNWYVGLARAAATSASVYAQISSIKNTKYQGYMSGGYTGDGARDEVAGVVHRGEYVMDAATTARQGVGNLNAMRRGTLTGGVNVNVVNNVGAEVRAERLSSGDVQIMIDHAIEIKTPTLVATQLGNPNSKISKSLGRNTQVARRR